MNPLRWLVPAAIGLRLLIFIGRGDFVAFDESWYLLLGKHLWAGEGYTLTGLRHTTLSPLFPILAGALALIVESPVWAGRIVAAVAGGLLVVPCWSIFNRIVGRRTALLACITVAVLPSLAPFTVPYWVGWDLWMGPEPVYHLFLYSGVALALRGEEGRHHLNWVLAGGAFALAYLARPEGIVVAGIVGLAILVSGLRRGSSHIVIRPVLFAFAFVVVAVPYWLYLHDALGRWTINGRHVEVPRVRAAEKSAGAGRAGAGRASPANSIERMIWQGEQDDYIQVLFALHPSGERLSNSYWGVHPADTQSRAADHLDRDIEPASTGHVIPATDIAEETPEGGGPPAAGPAALVSGSRTAEAASERIGPPAAEAVAEAAETPIAEAEDHGPPNRLLLYARALGVVIPGFVWPFVFFGMLAPRRRKVEKELLVALPLVVASIMIAGWVAVDPRTQLFVAPWLALYAARGIRILGLVADRRLRKEVIRRGLVKRALAGGVVGLLLLGNVGRLYSSIREGSPHHILGVENRRIGRTLREIIPEESAIMSWDASVALYAGRDWRVLPYGTFPEIARYAAAIGCEYVVLSRFYPAPEIMEQVQANFLVLHLPPTEIEATRWNVELTGSAEGVAFGRVTVE